MTDDNDGRISNGVPERVNVDVGDTLHNGALWWRCENDVAGIAWYYAIGGTITSRGTLTIAPTHIGGTTLGRPC